MDIFVNFPNLKNSFFMKLSLVMFVLLFPILYYTKKLDLGRAYGFISLSNFVLFLINQNKYEMILQERQC